MLLEHYLPTLEYSDMGVHAVLLADFARVDAYRRAIESMVKPGMRVLELGAGTGVIGRVAASKGADVIMVEVQERPCRYAQLLNELLGGDSEIQLINARIEEVQIEPCDVVVHELLGGRLFDEGLTSSLRAFARNNRWFLMPSTRIIPERLSLWCRFVCVDPTSVHERLPNGQELAALSDRECTGSVAVIWATSASDFIPASDWFCFGDMLAHDVEVWPDHSSVARVEVYRPANAVLWGFRAHLGRDVLLDGRLGVGPRTSWGGTIELLKQNLVISAGSYSVESCWNPDRVGANGSWIEALRKH